MTEVTRGRLTQPLLKTRYACARWKIKKTKAVTGNIHRRNGIPQKNESPIMAIPISQKTGVKAGAMMPVILLLQPLLGKKIRAIQELKYKITPIR